MKSVGDLAFRLIRDFEKSARINEMKPSLIISRKRELNEQLNGFEQQRKQHAANMDNRKALLLKGAKGVPAPELKHSKCDSENLATCHSVRRCISAGSHRKGT